MPVFSPDKTNLFFFFCNTDRFAGIVDSVAQPKRYSDDGTVLYCSHSSNYFKFDQHILLLRINRILTDQLTCFYDSRMFPCRVRMSEQQLETYKQIICNPIEKSPK